MIQWLVIPLQSETLRGPDHMGHCLDELKEWVRLDYEALSCILEKIKRGRLKANLNSIKRYWPHNWKGRGIEDSTDLLLYLKTNYLEHKER